MQVNMMEVEVGGRLLVIGRMTNPLRVRVVLWGECKTDAVVAWDVSLDGTVAKGEHIPYDCAHKVYQKLRELLPSVPLNVSVAEIYRLINVFNMVTEK